MKSPSSQHTFTQPKSQQQLSSQQHILLLSRVQRRPLNFINHLNSKTQRLDTKTNLDTANQIQQYRKISKHLSLMQTLKKVNSQKIQKLQKNVSNLDFLRRLSHRQTIKVQNRKAKFQQTQSMVYFLERLKKDKQRKSQQKLEQRRRLCYSLRESSVQNKQLSMSAFNIVKQQRLRQFKERNEQLLQSYERSLQQLLQENRQKAHRTRVSEQKLKEKLKKYEEYKIYVGRVNYEKKLQSEYKKHLQNKRYLGNVKVMLKEQDKMFRKTEKLKKETKKIEDFYLTGTGAE